MHLRTAAGVVEIQVWHGQNGRSGSWGCPIRERWGLSAHQQMSPGLEANLAFTATRVSSYENAAQVAAQWGTPVGHAVIHQLVQRLGARAESRAQKRLQKTPQERQPQLAPAELGNLMIDGWMARFRGAGWGRKKTKKERVEWHEIKTGVFFRQDQRAATATGRGVISEKVLVRWQGAPLEFGQRLGWEATRHGLGRAKEILFLADGGKWIWNLAKDRWPSARQLLDFYHASEHLNDLAAAFWGDEAAAKRWVQKILHQLRHGQEKRALAEIAALKAPRGARGKLVRKEKAYFARQSARMNYAELAARGWPIGSGPVESACRQSQGRFKCSGQFWTKLGFRHLSALDEARRNHHWDEIWLTA